IIPGSEICDVNVLVGRGPVLERAIAGEEGERFLAQTSGVEVIDAELGGLERAIRFVELAFRLKQERVIEKRGDVVLGERVQTLERRIVVPGRHFGLEAGAVEPGSGASAQEPCREDE